MKKLIFALMLLPVIVSAQTSITLDDVYYRARADGNIDSAITQVEIDSSKTSPVDTLYFFFDIIDDNPPGTGIEQVQYNSVLTFVAGADTIGASDTRDSLGVFAKGLYKNDNGTITGPGGETYMMVTSNTDSSNITAPTFVWGTGYVEGALLISKAVNFRPADGVAIVISHLQSQSIILKNMALKIGNVVRRN